MSAREHAALSRLRGESLEGLLARLQTSSEGLGGGDVARRLKAFGPNELHSAHVRSELTELVHAAANPLVIILLIAGAASAFLGEITQAVLIAGIVLLSSGINVWQTFRSQRAVSRLQADIAPTATAGATACGSSYLDATSWLAMSFV